MKFIQEMGYLLSICFAYVGAIYTDNNHGYTDSEFEPIFHFSKLSIQSIQGKSFSLRCGLYTIYFQIRIYYLLLKPISQ